MPRLPVRRLRRAALLVCAASVLPSATALAAQPPGTGRIAVKDARHAAAAAAARSTGTPAVARARAALVRRLGPTGVVDIETGTGTVRSAARLDGALTGPSGARRATVVRGWLRENATALGLDRADVDALGAPATVTAPGGLAVLRFGQAVGGIPTFGGGIRAGVDRAGRLVSVTGSPIHALRVNTRTPALSAAQALRALAREVGGGQVPAVRRARTGPRRATTFVSGDVARLVFFGAGSKQRLGWHLTYSASRTAWWDAVVDALTGKVLYRQNLIRHAAPASVYPNFPGARAGGTPTPVDLEALGYLAPGAPVLSGPFAHAYSDVDGDNAAAATEEVGRTAGGFTYPLTSFNGVAHPGDDPAAPRCTPTAVCTWNSSDRRTWTANRAQTTVQAFWFNGNWHDHLRAAPIGFDAASGNFEGTDPVQVETDDTIATNDPQLNNANMGTPPDGQSPRMQMYLGAYDNDGDGNTTSDDDLAEGDGLFRDYNNSDDAATVYHEYTHGLTNRLVTNNDGSGALSSAQAGAMGEAWSDWYAFDYLVAQGLSPDTAAPGEVDIGIYSDAIPNATRFQPLDCAPGDGAPACPGGAGTGPGGFTYADFGRVCCSPTSLRPQVHSDGEIWAETLWDLRRAVGSEVARALVTGGLRLSPPEPSFLDMRNSILQADAALYGSSHANALWAVFAARGMGYFAAASDGTDVAPVADSTTPEAAAALPTGTLRGRVTDQDTGTPVAGAVIGIGGLSTPGFSGRLAATTAADGTYTLTGVPEHAYPKVSVIAGGGYFTAALGAVEIRGGQATTRDVTVRKSLAVGAPLTTDDATGGAYGCGPAGLTDGSFGTVWELDLAGAQRQPGYRAHATVDLGRPTDVYSYGIDPSPGCGSGAAAAARGYVLESSPDGQTWTTVGQGTLDDDVPLNALTPSGAAARGVRYVRLTVIADQEHVDYGYLDVAELAVFGHALPAGSLAATREGGTAVRLDAAFSTDPRAVFTAYDWDFDGNGVADRRTATASTTFGYPGPGTFSPVVTVADSLGGTGSARTAVTIPTARPSAPAPRPRARPRIGFPAARKGVARLRVVCQRRCRVRATLAVSRSTARRLARRKRTLAARSLRMRGTRIVELRLSKGLQRSLRRRHVRSFRATVRVVVTEAGGGQRRAARAVRIRL